MQDFFGKYIMTLVHILSISVHLRGISEVKEIFFVRNIDTNYILWTNCIIKFFREKLQISQIFI